MTRDTQPGFDPRLYDEDFFRWTQQQAAALRTLAPDSTIDIAHLAEEIADLGKRDLREVMSYLALVIRHLVKLQAAPNSRDAAHWHAEATHFQRAARRAFSPGMRQLIDVTEAWTDGCHAAGRFLKDHGAAAPPNTCPFTLDDLLGSDFDVAAAVDRIAAG